MQVAKVEEATMTFRSRPRVLCDADDVLVDYVEGFTAAVISTGVRNIKMDHKYDQWDLSKSLKLSEEEDNKVYALINMPGFASKLNPLPGAVEGLKRVMEVADVLFVTSPLKSSPTWAYDRRLWFEKHFGEEQGEKIVSTAEKYAVDGDFLIDDKPEHCKSWQAEHPMGMALMWATGRNEGHVPMGIGLVGNWPIVYELVKYRGQAMKAAAK